MGRHKSVSLIPVLVSFLFGITFTGSALAGAAEDLYPTIYDKAMRERNGITVSNIKARDGVVTFDAKQDVIIGGSKHSITQKGVSLNAANDAFYNKTASLAKNFMKAGLAGAAGAAALGVILDGVDYVMGEGGQIQKKPDLTGIDPNYTYTYKGNLYQSPMEVCKAAHPNASSISSASRPNMQQVLCYYRMNGGSLSAYNYVTIKPRTPEQIPKPEPVSDSVAQDAFGNWLKNNPTSLTDPVLTYIYSPKSSTGQPVPSTTSDHPSFGQNEINDEMMENYINNYKESLANDEYWQEKINNSNQTETVTDPAGSSTTTTINPDGSTTTTTTETVVNPETGEITTNKTETTTNLDGSTSTKTETTTQTAPKPEISELPVVCEYFAFLCEWTEWTKKNWEDFTEIKDDDTEVEIQIPEVSEDYNLSVSGSCPSSFVLIDTTVMGMPYKIEFEWGDFCNILSSYVKPILIALASFYAILIVAGVRNNA